MSYPQTQLSQKLRLQSPPQTPNSLFLLWCCVSICVLFLSSSSAERHGKDGTRPIGQIRHILSWYQIHSKYLQPVYSHWLCYMCHCNLAVIITVNGCTHTANVLSAEYTDVCLRSKFKNKQWLCFYIYLSVIITAKLQWHM